MTMKKLTGVFVMLLLTVNVQAQWIHANKTYGTDSIKRSSTDITMFFPTFAVAPSGKASLHATDLHHMALYGDSLHKKLWVYNPKDSSWTDITAGGSGTLTSFSSGNLSPLFTTSVATSTTTPAQTFSLTNAAGHTLFGRGTGTGAPSYLGSIDSNWIPALHSQTYYDGRYLQTSLNFANINLSATGNRSHNWLTHNFTQFNIGSYELDGVSDYHFYLNPSEAYIVGPSGASLVGIANNTGNSGYSILSGGNTSLYSLHTNNISGADSVVITSPKISINSSYYLPRYDGTVNQVLTTDGAGVTSWQNAGGGSATTIYNGDGVMTDRIIYADIPNGTALGFHNVNQLYLKDTIHNKFPFSTSYDGTSGTFSFSNPVTGNAYFSGNTDTSGNNWALSANDPEGHLLLDFQSSRSNNANYTFNDNTSNTFVHFGATDNISFYSAGTTNLIINRNADISLATASTFGMDFNSGGEGSFNANTDLNLFANQDGGTSHFLTLQAAPGATATLDGLGNFNNVFNKVNFTGLDPAQDVLTIQGSPAHSANLLSIKNNAGTTTYANVAYDGSGFLASGNIFWNSTGLLTTIGLDNYNSNISGSFTGLSKINKDYADVTYAPISITGTVTSVARTNGLGITASVANSTTTPNITIAVDTSDVNILSRQRATNTYAPITAGKVTAYQYATPTTGSTVSSTGEPYLIINPAGAILALTVNFPTSPADGQLFNLASTQAVTTVTLSAGSNTIDGALTSLAANGTAGWMFTTNGTQWVKVHN